MSKRNTRRKRSRHPAKHSRPHPFQPPEKAPSGSITDIEPVDDDAARALFGECVPPFVRVFHFDACRPLLNPGTEAGTDVRMDWFLSRLLYSFPGLSKSLLGSTIDACKDTSEIVRCRDAIFSRRAVIAGSLVLVFRHINFQNKGLGIVLSAFDLSSNSFFQFLFSDGDLGVETTTHTLTGLVAGSGGKVLEHPIVRVALTVAGLAPQDLSASAKAPDRRDGEGRWPMTPARLADTLGHLLSAEIESVANEACTAKLSKAEKTFKEQKAFYDDKHSRQLASARRAAEDARAAKAPLEVEIEALRKKLSQSADRLARLERDIEDRIEAAVAADKDRRMAEARAAVDTELHTLQSRLAEAERMAHEKAEEAHDLGVQVDALLDACQGAAQPDSEPDFEAMVESDPVEAMRVWSEHSLPSGVVVAPKALRAVRKAPSADYALALRVLNALRDDYLPMRKGDDPDAKSRWDGFVLRERLDYGPPGVAIEHARYRDSYSVSLGGQLFPLDLHIQGSSSRREDEGFRLYFHYDASRHRVIVGHFPTHLPCLSD